MSRLLDVALEMASHGWRVFPVFAPKPDGSCSCSSDECRKAGKHPAITKWQERATTDTAQINTWWEHWPNANVAIATGKASNLLVLDADGPKGQMEIDQRGTPLAPSVRTGRVDGGTHFYFTCPSDFDARNFASELPGLDARANGGYVIAAGSKHETGHTYHWVVKPTDVSPPEPPKWFVNVLKKLSSAKTGESGNRLIEGGRNDALFGMARAMRRNGQSEESVLASISRVNREDCKPPLPEHEIVTLVASACKGEYGVGPDLTARIEDPDLGAVETTGKFLREIPLTEAGNAECFTELYGGAFRYIPEWRRWFKWNKSIWAEDKSMAHKRGMLMTVRARGMAAALIPDQEQRKAFLSWARSQETNSRINGALALAAVLPSVSAQAEQFDVDQWSLGMKGMTWDLKEGRGRPPRMGDYITRTVGTNYDAAERCPLWHKVLDDVFLGDKEMVAYFKRAVGYSLTGVNSEQVMFICVGSGANGKSTILGTIRDVFGTYAASARFETFDADVKSTTGDDLAALRGKRLVLVIEADLQRKLAEGRIKQVTGGTDLITCRHLYGQDFSYRPEFKIWMAVNHKPTIRGQDEGIWRRIHLVPFNAHFGDSTRDPFLDEKLRKELPGILNWALEGAVEWRETGLKPPEQVMQATKEYRQESDIIGLWLADCAAEDPKAETTQAEVYMSYRNWAGENGQRPMSANMLGRALTERGMARGTNKKRKTTYKGIAITEASWSLAGDS